MIGYILKVLPGGESLCLLQQVVVVVVVVVVRYVRLHHTMLYYKLLHSMIYNYVLVTLYDVILYVIL